jgi:hypothetical protein
MKLGCVSGSGHIEVSTMSVTGGRLSSVLHLGCEVHRRGSCVFSRQVQQFGVGFFFSPVRIFITARPLVLITNDCAKYTINPSY